MQRSLVRIRRRIAVATVAILCLAGGFAVSAASAATEAYCSGCGLAEYGNFHHAPVFRFITVSYAHDLSFPNGWIGAGSSNGLVEYNPNESTAFYSGANELEGVIVSHIHASITANAHVDY
jgi:hypothetical protein